MKPDKQLIEAWEGATALGNAWLVFGYAKNRKRYFELRREGGHHGLQGHMEHELIWRISDGEFQAFGIEHGSDAGPIPIPKYYFTKTAEVDWDRETVEAFGKKFYEVRVQGEREREPAEEAPESELEEIVIIDPCEISAPWQRERSDETLPIEPEPSDVRPTKEEQRESRNEMLPPKPTPSAPNARGRPSKVPEIEQAIELLMKRGVDLAAMPRPQAYDVVRTCAAAELNSNTKIGFADPVIQRVLFQRFGPRR
jgi:hypothetical protein